MVNKKLQEREKEIEKEEKGIEDKLKTLTSEADVSNDNSKNTTSALAQAEPVNETKPALATQGEEDPFSTNEIDQYFSEISKSTPSLAPLSKQTESVPAMVQSKNETANASKPALAVVKPVLAATTNASSNATQAAHQISANQQSTPAINQTAAAQLEEEKVPEEHNHVQTKES